jgi:hypothetical protein
MLFDRYILVSNDLMEALHRHRWILHTRCSYAHCMHEQEVGLKIGLLKGIEHFTSLGNLTGCLLNMRSS